MRAAFQKPGGQNRRNPGEENAITVQEGMVPGSQHPVRSSDGRARLLTIPAGARPGQVLDIDAYSTDLSDSALAELQAARRASLDPGAFGDFVDRVRAGLAIASSAQQKQQQQASSAAENDDGDELAQVRGNAARCLKNTDD